MLSSAAIIEVVAAKVKAHAIERLVVDPVMVAKSGALLLQPDAVHALIERLLPRALVLTPNVPEAEALTGLTITELNGMRQAARQIHGLGPRYVVLKGGHLQGRAIDLLFDGSRFTELDAERIDTPHTHGTGCVFSSAIAAELAKGSPVPEAVATAKRFITAAIRYGFRLGFDFFLSSGPSVQPSSLHKHIAHPRVDRHCRGQAERSGGQGNDLVEFPFGDAERHGLADTRVDSAFAHGTDGDAELHEADRLLVHRPVLSCLADHLPGLAQLGIAGNELRVDVRGLRYWLHEFLSSTV